MLLFIVSFVIFNILVLWLNPGPTAYTLMLMLFVSLPQVPNLIRMWRLLVFRFHHLPCQLVIHRERTYWRALTKGIVGIAESYLDKDWDCDRIDILVEYIYTHRLDNFARRFPLSLNLIVTEFRCLRNWFYATSIGTAVMEHLQRNPEKLLAEEQYNTGNDFFHLMQGPTRAYTCAQWEPGITTLEDAQYAKFESICKRLGLKKEEFEENNKKRLLDIGCGNAPFIRYVTKHYGVTAVGITTSEEQAKSAREFCQGLPVEILVVNYKKYAESGEEFDFVVSIGMFEAVLLKDYATYAEAIKKLLKPQGYYFHHSIIRTSTSNSWEETNPNPWMDREIFPGNYLPTKSELLELSIAMGSWPEQVLRPVNERFLEGTHYDRTLMTWYHNLVTHWEEISKNPKYDERFFRKWQLWLTACAGSFRAGRYGVMQITFQHVPPPETQT